MILLFIFIIMLSNSVQKFVVFHYSLLLLMAFFFILFFFALILVLLYEKNINSSHVLTLSLCESYIIGFISAYTNPKVVFMVVLCIFIIVVTLVLYSIITTTDVTIFGELLCIFLMAIILFFMFTIFTNYSFFRISQLLLVAILACFYIIFEIKINFGNGKIGTTSYIIPAFMIYTDLFVLFTLLCIFFDRYIHF